MAGERVYLEWATASKDDRRWMLEETASNTKRQITQELREEIFGEAR